MSQYTVEQIEASILAYKAGDLNYCRAGIIDLLTAYAATLRQNPERRVSSEEVRLSLDYSRNFARANPRLSKTTVEHIEGLCNLVERLAALSAEPAAQGEAVAPFIVGNAYRTLAGDLVRFVSVHNEGTSYETMADEDGVHRYTRHDFGRVTGTAHDYSDPRNTPPLYTAPPAQPAAQGEVRPKAFGIACTVAWTELHNAMAADGMNPPAASRIEEAAMTAPDVNADVRARFEAWATDEGYAVERYKDSYQAADTRNAWWGFQAAHADLAGEVTKLLRDVRSIYIGQERPAGDGCDAETWDRIEAALAKHTHQEKP